MFHRRGGRVSREVPAAQLPERGIATPFTTPLLAGARLRVAVGRGFPLLETIIPNPSGGRGAYVVRLGERSDLCRPTLHDRRLGEMLAARPDLEGCGPAMVRRAGWIVAAEGLAGRPAAEAARAAMAADAARTRASGAWLERAAGGFGRERLVGLDRLAAIAAELHDPSGGSAPAPALAEAVGALSRELADWATHRSDATALAGHAVAATAEFTHSGVRPLVERAALRLEDAGVLLRDWLANRVKRHPELDP